MIPQRFTQLDIQHMVPVDHNHCHYKVHSAATLLPKSTWLTGSLKLKNAVENLGRHSYGRRGECGRSYGRGHLGRRDGRNHSIMTACRRCRPVFHGN
jgi:hypothetical protein